MVAKSMSIRMAQRFEIPDQGYDILAGGNGVSIGTITPIIETLNIERHTIRVFNATYQETIKEQITVFDRLEDDYLVYDQYQTERQFKMFYNEQTRMLFSSAPSRITQRFLKHLEKNSPQDGTHDDNKPDVNGITGIQFDFRSVAELLLTTKVIRFGSEDEHVNAKTFSGESVIENEEANDAIVNDDATQLIGGIRIGTSDFTISISKPGTLVVYNPIAQPNEDRPYPLLEFVLQSLKELRIIE